MIVRYNVVVINTGVITERKIEKERQRKMDMLRLVEIRFL